MKPLFASRQRQYGFSLLRTLLLMAILVVAIGVVYLFLPVDNSLQLAPTADSTAPSTAEATANQAPPASEYSVAELQQLQPIKDASEDLQAAVSTASSVDPDASATPPALGESSLPSKTPLSDRWNEGGNLDSSDGLVRQALAKLDSEQQLLGWLVDDELIRRFVVLVDNLANGDLVQKHMVLKPVKKSFMAIPSAENYIIDPVNYSRYKAYLGLFSRLPAESVVAAYQRFYPLLQQAYAELGYPRRSFHHRLLAAVERVLMAPLPVAGEPLLMTQPSVMYKYVDPEIEQRSDIEKLLIRMGPDNAADLKDTLWQWKRLLIQLDHRQ